MVPIISQVGPGGKNDKTPSLAASLPLLQVNGRISQLASWSIFISEKGSQIWLGFPFVRTIVAGC